MSIFEDLKKELNLKKGNKILSFEMNIIEKSNQNLFTLGYNFVHDNTFDLIVDLGPYGMGSPAYNYPCPKAKKLRITVEIIE